MDANIAKSNAVKYKANLYKEFLKVNKDRLAKVLADIQKLSLSGKREIEVHMTDKYIEQAKQYLLGLGFGVHILRYVNPKNVSITEQYLRVTW